MHEIVKAFLKIFFFDLMLLDQHTQENIVLDCKTCLQKTFEVLHQFFPILGKNYNFAYHEKELVLLELQGVPQDKSKSFDFYH